MTDTYQNWAQLAAANLLNVDYRLKVRKHYGSTVSHIAIHGGGIEPGTAEVASNCAAFSYQNFYALEGIKSSGNSTLSIVSTNYDEPHALSMVESSTHCISYHGYNGVTNVSETRISGFDIDVVNAISASLTKSGFTVINGSSEPPGTDQSNIVTKTKSGLGVQIEMSNSLRASFFPNGDLTRANRESGLRTDSFYQYARAITRVTNGIEQRSQQSSNYSLNQPLGSDDMGDYESWMNSNWSKIDSVNRWRIYPSVPYTGNFKYGERIYSIEDQSTYVCACNDPKWGIMWRPIHKAISPWRNVGNAALMDTANFSAEIAPRQLQIAMDNRGKLYFRGALRYMGPNGGVTKDTVVNLFYPMPPGIQPRQNMTFVIGHSFLSVSAGVPPTEWEGVILTVPYGANGSGQPTTMTILGGTLPTQVNQFYFDGQVEWPVGGML